MTGSFAPALPRRRYGSLLERLFRRRDVQGFVEVMARAEIRGWAVSRAGRPLRFELLLDGRSFRPEVIRTERTDVATEHEAELNCGFTLVLSELESTQLRRVRQQGGVVDVLANSEPLNNIAEFVDEPDVEAEVQGGPGSLAAAPAGPAPLPAGSVLWRADCAGAEIAVDCWELFRIAGSVRGIEQGVTVSLRCGAHELCSDTLLPDPDEARAGAVRFELDVPGRVWESLAAGHEAMLGLDLDGTALEPVFRLDEERLLGWIRRLFRAAEIERAQLFAALLALEHLRVRPLWDRLDARTSANARRFALQMGLADFVLGKAPRSAVAHLPEIPATTLMQWRALKYFNTLLGGGESVHVRVQAVLRELRLRGEARDRFLLSVVPLACRERELDGIAGMLDRRRTTTLAASEDAWGASLALALLLQAGYVTRAINVLTGLPKLFAARGWLNTECLLYSVRRISELENDGVVGTEQAHRFRTGMVDLIDSFRGEWFSRVHDRSLVETMLHMLCECDRFNDAFVQQLGCAAIRAYGLNPWFWRRAAELGLLDPAGALAVAYDDWARIEATLERGDIGWSERLELLETPLGAFVNAGNRDADVLLRESLVHALCATNGVPAAAARRLLRRLVALDPQEVLRFRALPAPGTEPPVGTADEVRAAIRARAVNGSSSVLGLQQRAAEALRAACAAIGDEAVTEVLVQRARALACWEGMFLGPDLLAGLAVRAAEQGLPSGSLLMAVTEWVIAAIEGTKVDWALPAPVQAALASLRRVAPRSPLLAAASFELEEMVRAKFGDRHEAALAAPHETPRLDAGMGWPGDTLVVIYSCRKYLDTRIPAIRATWVQDLRARGIPHVVLVGAGEDTLDGDVLSLRVSDSYEDLPRKTIRLFDWVFRNTEFQYVLKIDDDCFLDVEQFFGSLSYRKHFYSGRVIRRPVGGTDRVWHVGKSQSETARNAFDKSPEPSIYADGGGAYTLSRYAMHCLLHSARSAEGQRLIASSFMEDKLVGDLLAMHHYIEPSGEDHATYQRRRTHPGARPVGMYENTFFPSALAPVKIAHLDTEQDMAFAQACSRGAELLPKKLWPTCASPGLDPSSSQLELLSPPARLHAIAARAPLVVSVVRNEMTLLPHFLAHHRALGFDGFLFVDNCSDDGTREYLLEQEDVALFSADTPYKLSHYGVAWQQALLGNLCLGKWVLLADADEMLVYAQCEQRDIHALLQEAESAGANAIFTDMVDMYPEGDLADADFEQRSPFDAAPWFDRNPLRRWRMGSGAYSSATTWVSSLRHRLAADSEPNAFTSQKCALFRYQPWIRISQGVHDLAHVEPHAQGAWFAHFKYHAGFARKVETEIARGQHFNNAQEYRRYAVLLAEGRGRFRDPQLSVRYEGSASFVQHATRRD